MPRALIILLLFAAASLRAQEVRFNRDIRPILSDKCFACHGPDEGNRSSPLRFDDKDGAFVELRTGGRAIVPGEPAQSKLLDRVRSDDPMQRMPPAYKGHQKLTEREIALLEKWIEQGAEWEGHWAFQRIERPQVPPSGEGWARGPIDRFVARRLDREDLRPNREADRRTWARRATLDLTGLPPAPDEVEAFVADRAPDAYERFADRLLASPRYGERMAFRWLEAARYADTNGYQNDQERDMWRWRDWVIEAFNKNLPFDDFTVWQLAGDLLPEATHEQILATGFNRNHRGNGEAGIVPEEYHVEYVVDRVETTAMVWMGLSLGCARCHDHKYDPLTQQEFYQIYAYFNQVPDRGRYFKYGNTPPFIHAPTDGQRLELQAIDDRIETAQSRFAALQSSLERDLGAWRPAQDWRLADGLVFSALVSEAAELDGERFEDLGDAGDFSFYDRLSVSVRVRPDGTQTAGVVTRATAESERGQFGGKGWGLFLDQGRPRFMLGANPDDVVDVRAKEPLPNGTWSRVTAVYDGSRLAKGITVYVDGSPIELDIIEDHSNNEITTPKTPLRAGHGPTLDARLCGAVADVRLYKRNLTAQEAAVLAVERSLSEIASLPASQRSPAEAAKLRLAFLDDAVSGEPGRLWQTLSALRDERQAKLDSFPTVMVMSDSAGRKTHLLQRGVYDAPGVEVSPGLPAVLPPLPPANRTTGWVWPAGWSAATTR
jgi:hypothetical protein